MVLNCKNYYEILEIEIDATSSEIKTAYRKLARKYHPDINKTPEAIDVFKKITEAYDTLSSPKKREQYNILKGIFSTEKNSTSAKEKNVSTNNNKNIPPQKKETTQKTPSSKKTKEKTTDKFSIIKAFKVFFAKQKRIKRTKENKKTQKGKNITTDISITPDEIITGSKRIVNIRTTKTCPKCFGHKFINGGKCEHCNGVGEISKTKKITVTIPKGIKNGTKLRIKGEGESGRNGGENGDLYLNINLETKTKTHIDKLNIYYNVPITPFEAVLGEEIKISTFDGTIKLKLPPNTTSGQKFRITGQGIKKNGKIGDLIIVVSIEISDNLSDDEIKLYNELKNLSKDDIRKNLINES